MFKRLLAACGFGGKPATCPPSGYNAGGLQAKLNALGHPVAMDGQLGPQTMAALIDHVSKRKVNRPDLALALCTHLPLHGISTPLRLAHFLAQAAHETGGFNWLAELWGPTPAQRRYEGRSDLGNTQAGDGKRFMGRGIFQLTGRANYRRYGTKLGLPLEDNPSLAASAEVSTRIACTYWNDRKLNAKADLDDLNGITRAINGGVNGLADRAAKLARAKQALL